jgi:hypothetical protein
MCMCMCMIHWLAGIFYSTLLDGKGKHDTAKRSQPLLQLCRKEALSRLTWMDVIYFETEKLRYPVVKNDTSSSFLIFLLG